MSIEDLETAVRVHRAQGRPFTRCRTVPAPTPCASGAVLVPAPTGDAAQASCSALSTLQLSDAHVFFFVSRDEEYVRMQAIAGDVAFDLGVRDHNYLLLILARRRLAEAGESVPEESRGWIVLDDFAHDPSFAPAKLNMHVFRIRRQFMSIGLRDGARIIERRPSTRQLRLGTARVSIATI